MKIEMPFDEQAEMYVLSSCINNMEAADEALEILTHAHFYSEGHKILFKAISACYDSGDTICPYSLECALDNAGMLEKIGGLLVLKNIACFAGTGLNYSHYIQKVKEIHQRREYIEMSYSMLKDAQTETETETLIEKAFNQLDDIGTGFKNSRIVNLKHAAGNFDGQQGFGIADMIKTRCDQFKQGFESFPGIRTGFDQLDEAMRGLQKGHLVVIGARPGVGKSTAMLNIVRNVCLDGRNKAGIFSLEMSRDEVLQKLISMSAHVDYGKLQIGDLSEHEIERVNQAIAEVEEYGENICIDDQSSVNITQLKRRAARMKRAFGIDILFIDYLTLLKGPKCENKQIEVEELSKSLRSLAKDLNITVVVLSQLNRSSANESRAPTIADLRSSGQIEQDAHEIILLYRKDVGYTNNINTQIVWKIDKSRFGQRANVQMEFNGSTGMMYEQPRLDTENGISEF